LNEKLEGACLMEHMQNIDTTILEKLYLILAQIKEHTLDENKRLFGLVLLYEMKDE